MSEAIEKVITDDQRIALLMAISKSDGALPQTLPALANQLGVSVGDVVDLLNDPLFIKMARALTKAQASLSFHQNVNRVSDIAATAKPKLALAAMAMLGKISGDLTPHKIVDMRVTFDDLRSRSEATGGADPLANLFEIKGDVIEAEIKQEAEADDYEQWEADNAG